MVEEIEGVPFQWEEGAVKRICEWKGTLSNPKNYLQKVYSGGVLLWRSMAMWLAEILHNFLMFFSCLPNQYCHSVTYIFIKQVRILLHIGGQEVCRCSNKKCATLMPRSVSWRAISRNSQHDLGTWPWDMTSRHDHRTGPRNMTVEHESGAWPWTMTSQHDLRTWTHNMNWKRGRCAWTESLRAKPEMRASITVLNFRS